MKYLLIILVVFSFELLGSDVYVTANIENISTDFALSKAGLVIKVKNADYSQCDGKYVKFYLEDFKSQALDQRDAEKRLEFSKSLALAAYLSNKKIQFILKGTEGSTCTSTGWLKILD